MTDETKNFIVVKTTTASRNEAELIAKKLVELQLAACVQISPIKSCFRWQEKICFEEEFCLSIKSRKSLFEDLRAEICRINSYQTPQIFACDICEIDEKYGEWLNSACFQTKI